MRFIIYIFMEGKLPAFFKSAIAEYEKRLGRYCKLELHWIKKEKEWDKRRAEEVDGYLVIPGKSLVSSEDLSKKIGDWESSGARRVVFFVTDQSVSDSEGPTFSISEFNLSSEMIGLVLCEQIYRGYRILHNHPYHK